MVMRETSGFSVRPTVRESMLKARRRNSEATRVRTPGLFSTYTTNVFSMDVLLVSSSFYDRARATDHFVQRRSGCDHRINRVFLLNRSEERRVGKEVRLQRWLYNIKTRDERSCR